MKQHVIVIAALGICCMGAGSADAYFSYMPSVTAPPPAVQPTVTLPPAPPPAPLPPPATTVTPLPVQPMATTAETAPPITPAPASPSASGVVEKALQESATATENRAPEPAPLPALPVTQFAAPVVAAEEWALRPAPLRNQLGVWAERAGYELVWKAENDYHLEYQASFRGSLTEALQQLFGALHKQGAPLRVTLYETNKIITVIEE